MADRSIPHSLPPNPTDPEQTFGNSKANLQIGAPVQQANSFQDAGFGYVGAALQHKPPAVIAYEQTSAAGETNGDLVFGTRSTTDGSAAASRVMRIRASGAVEVDGDTTVSETLRVNKDVTLDADLVVTKAATAWTHSGNEPGRHQYQRIREGGVVQSVRGCESVRFTMTPHRHRRGYEHHPADEHRERRDRSAGRQVGRH